ncbi:hypothetical protein [Ramlibacter humi]|uniref:Copper resistance protein D domain-containing protein n=1 Tax=Ramlibacter humi TaxID=2530451 RepID=A0A4Z0BFG5_9BURK|nr:hypothetical protein [Ramlibacter humi]TFY96598.1 hypothetical protein EZ216_20305 [Ramlibacter humi]
MLYPLARTLHLIALLGVAAGAVGALLLLICIQRVMRESVQQAAGLSRVCSTFADAASRSALLMLVTGALLMAARDWSDWGKGWLLAKAVAFLALSGVALWLAKPSTRKLSAVLTAVARGTTDRRAAMAALRAATRICAAECLALVALVATSVLAPH